ncbi:serine/threonine-protein kinase HipA [Kineosphaera limosa]|uniref:HipA-like C-terminal domain-containing protein n=1 Tax=Kineosphaera limosa NBRC 100340 TaxID=1184609 RepID=K6W8B7_9MICO|nr:type II toxin-antitoxin system HipA family toxin [Kineosphaera limosa]NYE01387.1 serine/threonine-protein kinase HipA [Kineosphaera limosa]GAB95440.1 hypothetical protein KILIM_020_00080 [Kineosphaera limosa NBRC 100340]
MTTSEATAAEDRPVRAFAWAWLPNATEPVLTGRIDVVGDRHFFTYARSYLARSDAISLYVPELPLQRGPQGPANGLALAGCLRDAAPDAWGQRVILAEHHGRLTRSSDTGDLSILTYLLESGSNRIGALDFTDAADDYQPRHTDASLDELQKAAGLLDSGEPLSPTLAAALVRGTSIGGARPKALVTQAGQHWVAKFSSTTDHYPVVKSEALALALARRVGVNVPAGELSRSLGRDVLLLQRFDRTPAGGRRLLVSALTMLGLDEMFGRYATYVDLADLVRSRFTRPDPTLRELFSRIAFNICIGNTDDHARNHAAFWDGQALTLTPAYDLCPQPRSGSEAAQAMAYSPAGERASRLGQLVSAAHVYHLDEGSAQDIVNSQVEGIRMSWNEAAEAAHLTQVERDLLWGRQILNSFIFS